MTEKETATPYNFRIKTELLRELEEIRDEYGTPISFSINKAIGEYLHNLKNK
tara:strand:+ start:28679 stop:28834 length:156 start_codon:yes stop_codon:yes gene_type:complete